MNYKPLTDTQTGTLIRNELKSVFPGHKFTISVSSDYHQSLCSIEWVDGPNYSMVDHVARKWEIGPGNMHRYTLEQSRAGGIKNGIVYVSGIERVQLERIMSDETQKELEDNAIQSGIVELDRAEYMSHRFDKMNLYNQDPQWNKAYKRIGGADTSFEWLKKEKTFGVSQAKNRIANLSQSNKSALSRMIDFYNKGDHGKAFMVSLNCGVAGLRFESIDEMVKTFEIVKMAYGRV